MDDKKEKVIFFIKLIYIVIFYRGKRFVVVKNIYFLKFFKKNDFYITTMSFGFLRGRELFYTPIPAISSLRTSWQASPPQAGEGTAQADSARYTLIQHCAYLA